MSPKPNKKKQANKAEAEEVEEKENITIESGSRLMQDCKKAFNETDFYVILNLNKADAKLADIKKAYYKLSLKYHPDKCEENLKTESNFKFQILGKIYSVLSDEEKRKLYDECGVVDGEDDMFNSERDWENHWRMLFKKVTKDDISKFFENYKNSNMEKEDLLKFYEKHKGDMNLILEEMLSEDLMQDEERYKKIINEAIEANEVNKYDAFVNESKKKATKRKANFEKEAKEAELLKKELGIDESQENLKNLIVSRRKNQTESFLDHLAKKYETKPTKSKQTKKTNSNKKAAAKNDSESDEDEDSEQNDDTDDDDDDEEKGKKLVRKSSLIKRKSNSSAKKKSPVSNKHVIKKQVKRL